MTDQEVPSKQEMVIPQNFITHLINGVGEAKYYLRHDIGITEQNRKHVLSPDFIFYFQLRNDKFQWRYDPRNLTNHDVAFKLVFEDYRTMPFELSKDSTIPYYDSSSDDRKQSASYITLQNAPECILCFVPFRTEVGQDYLEKGVSFFHARYIDPYDAFLQTRLKTIDNPPIGKK